MPLRAFRQYLIPAIYTLHHRTLMF